MADRRTGAENPFPKKYQYECPYCGSEIVNGIFWNPRDVDFELPEDKDGLVLMVSGECPSDRPGYVCRNG